MDAYLLKDIRQVYEGRTVLEIPFLRIEAGSILGLFGPNGSGKSTLLRLLALLEDPVRGILRFQGHDVSSRDTSTRRKITLLDQDPYLLKRSVLGNVAYGLRVRGHTAVRDRVEDALEQVGLAPARFAGRRWHELSGGEAQRVALAARLVLKPSVLLLDEPTANLDQESTERIRLASLAARQEWGATIVLVSHDRAWLESASDRFLLMGRGRLSAQTSGPELRS